MTLSFLLSGSRLEQAAAWQAGSGIAVTPEEREFLEVSLAERERRLADEEARAAHERDLERRSVRRLRAVVGVLAVASLVAVGLTVFAMTQRGTAQRSAEPRSPASSPRPRSPTSTSTRSGASCWRSRRSTRPARSATRSCSRPRRRSTGP